MAAARPDPHHHAFEDQAARCRWLLWAFDDGDHDPRGILGAYSAGFSLDPAEYDQTGPVIGLCPSCGSARSAYYDTALRYARTRWVLST